MNQLAFNLATAGAQAAADRADRIHGDWTDKAYAAFVAYAKTHPKFTTEDVIAASPEVPQAPEKRAWGAIALMAKRRGLIRKVGFDTAKSAHAHSRPVSVWQLVA